MNIKRRKTQGHLIVSVGEGQGLLPTNSCGSGIVREGRGGFFFGVVMATIGTGATTSSIKDWN